MKKNWWSVIPIIGTIIEMVKEHREANKDIRELRKDIRVCRKQKLEPENYVNTTYFDKDLAWKEYRIKAIRDALEN